jgi:hypothetical protein
VEFSLAGTFSDSTGNSVGASFSLSFQNSTEAPVVFEFTEVFEFDQILGNTFTVTESGETTESFVSARAVIQVNVALPGIDNSSDLTIDIARTGLSDGEAFTTLEFNDKTVVFYGNSTDSESIVTDLGGVVAHIAENLETGLLEGYITVDNLEVATIEETENGMVIVRYADDSFESLSF